jgi:hypothetical protein
MLCVCYDGLRPLLSPTEQQELWRLLHRGTCLPPSTPADHKFT